MFFFEEPLFEDSEPELRHRTCPATGVRIVTPVLPNGAESSSVCALQKKLLENLILTRNIQDFVAWFYTPMAREFTSALTPAVTVYDCMDELSAFLGAPPAMQLNEQILLENADLVFTGGTSLYESKRRQHHAVYPFPSSVDVSHFRNARELTFDPPDQVNIPRPRLGYAGVIDERMDLDLIRELAAHRPDWHLVFIGPVVKIDTNSLPQASNIHYFGMKPYNELPNYFSGWDIGMLPFAQNPSTHFISPTKTPEYLAAGLQVISTPIRDVVATYGDRGLAAIASTSSEFIARAESLFPDRSSRVRLARVDEFLSTSSWDKTWAGMNRLIEAELETRQNTPRLTGNLQADLAHV